MKRFAILAVLAAVFWSVPAFGAESIRVLRNGEEVRLSQGIIRENGTLMLSLEDLAGLTESELRQDGNVTALGYRMEDGPVVLEYEQTATLVGDAVYDRLNRKIPLEGKILQKDGETYLPARTMANALGYTVKWSKTDGVETFSVERPVMPRITLDVAYDREGRRVVGTIRNREPQTFTYGDDFTLERMTEEGWERMREAEPRDINDIGYGMNSLWKGLSDGETDYARRLFCALPAGKYRIGVPFDFTYYIGVNQEAAESLWKDRLADWQNDPSPERARHLQWGLEYYYATKWAAPAFFFDGAEQELPDEGTYELLEGWYRCRENTSYVMYGEFEVE